MHKIGELQAGLRRKLENPRLSCFVHGGEVRRFVGGKPIRPGMADILVICGTANRDEMRACLDGFAQRFHLQPNRRKFMRTRHFTVDQVLVAADGTITCSDRAKTDLAEQILRPTHWAWNTDPARGEYGLSSRLCGRAVRLMVEERFSPDPALASYLHKHCEELLRSRGFWWHYARIDGVGYDPDADIARTAMRPNPLG